MVGSNTIHCARADTVTPTVTSASAMNFFMVCLSLCCRCRRQHAANHAKGFTTELRRRGVSGAQHSAKSVKGKGASAASLSTVPRPSTLLGCASQGFLNRVQGEPESNRLRRRKGEIVEDASDAPLLELHIQPVFLQSAALAKGKLSESFVVFCQRGEFR